MMDVAHATVECFKRLGISRIYGLIGTSILDFVDALYDYRDDIRFITTRHEQVAVSMADAEGRLTSKPGVAVVHVGGGFLNSLISVGIAYRDKSPVVILSGGVRRRLRGLESMYEIDQESIIRPIVKKAYVVDEPSKIVDIVSSAYNIAISPPYGPVYIEVPEDIWLNTSEYDFNICKEAIKSPPKPKDEYIDKVIEYLKDSERPLILAGGGINNMSSSSLLVRLLDSLKIPIVTTGSGRGVITEDHPLSLGRVGFGGGSTYADKALEKCDLLLALGCSLTDITTYSYNIIPKGDIILVNLDEKTDERPIPYSEWFYTDANVFLRKLVDKISSLGVKREYSGWIDEINSWRRGWERILDDTLSREFKGYVNPARFFKYLDNKLRDIEVIISAGQGMHILYAYSFLKARSYRSFLAATDLGAMGFAFPAALAAKTVYPNKEVIAIVGDGEFMMTLQDLETMVRENIPVKIVIVNDNSYRVLYYRQKLQKMGRIYGTLLTNPDFMRLAESFNIESLSLEDNSKIPDAVNKMLNTDKPFIVELKINPVDIPPLNLEASLKMTSL